MSYDLVIWCVKPADPARAGTVAKGKGWVVNVAVSACMAEDVPDEVIERLPGIQVRVDLSLEPIDAPKAGRTAVWKIAREIARSSLGVIEDPQEDSVELPSGVKRYTPIKHEPNARVSSLEMSWWFDHHNLLETAAIERFVDALQRWLPEAIPRRYGTYEPPEHDYAATGRAHFVAFLAENRMNSVVWYASRPVLYVSTSVGDKTGWVMHWQQRKFRCSRISIQLVGMALDQSGWQEGLRRAWRHLSRELRPFYGDVRTTGGHIARGRTLCADSETELHPVRSWWWRGLPALLGHAAVIGEPYLAAWPELGEHTTIEDGLAFVSTPDWRTADDAAALVGGVPERLTMPVAPGIPTLFSMASDEFATRYPAVFPFARE